MKAQAIVRQAGTTAPADWSGSPRTIASGLVAQMRGLEIVAGLATRLALTLLPAVAIVVLATFALADPNKLMLLQVMLWSTGFVFYGLSVDSEHPRLGALLLISGVLVQALSWMSRSQAAELAVVAAAVVAAWIAGRVGRFAFTRL